MQHIDSPAVGLNFDIGHAYCVGDDPATTIPRVAKYIRHFHLEDIAATRVHHHLVPGEGAIDFAATLRAIKAHRLRGLGDDRAVSLRREPGRGRPPRPASTSRSAGRRYEPTARLRPARCGCRTCRRPSPTSARASWRPGRCGRSAPLACVPAAAGRRRPASTAAAWCGTITSTSSRTDANGRFGPCRPGRSPPRQAALCGAGLVIAGIALAGLAGLVAGACGRCDRPGAAADGGDLSLRRLAEAHLVGAGGDGGVPLPERAARRGRRLRPRCQRSEASTWPLWSGCTSSA